MAGITVAFKGWNSSSQAWGGGTWGEDVGLPNATGTAGAVSINAAANVPVTGLAATGTVGSVTVTADANVNVTGVSGTGAVGAVSVTGTAVVPVTGIAATGAVGSVTIVAAANGFPPRS